MKQPATAALLVACALAAGNASATPFTLTSPVGGALPGGVSPIGGIVVDLVGSNATRIVAQTAASSLYIGFPDAPDYPFVIGTQTGFTAPIVAALGGGIAGAAFRFSLYDGDMQAGNFDFGQNGLKVNGIDLPAVGGGVGGDWSRVATERTTSDGATVLASGLGFGDDTLDTGWFRLTDATTLAAIYTTLASTSRLEFRLTDLTPGDQFFDFTQGIDAALVNVGSGPVVQPPPTGGSVPLPGSLALVTMGVGLAALARRRSVAA
jgi:hypothetical protein